MKHKVKHIHFVGIGGAGMSGIAEVFVNLGYQVSGSDLMDNQVTQRLAKLGIKVYAGHTSQQIAGADVVVISTAVKPDNPEVIAAKNKNIPVVPRALMLAELLRLRSGIAIAGTHGKTTTTSLIASILAAADMDPTFVIGGKLEAAGCHAKLGSGEFIVVEADESDASFLYLQPILTVVTNIDEDHMETYGHDFNRLKQTFVEFVQHLPFYGMAVVCVDDANVRDVLPAITKPITTYGLSEDAQVRAINIQYANHQMKFTAVVGVNGSARQLEITLNLPGLHNIQNALAAIAVANEIGVPDVAIVKALLEFKGVERRFQQYGEIKFSAQKSFALVDDYGHHPAEMEATIKAARGAFPGRRLVVAFQPHRYTRTRDAFEGFARVLSQVDVLLLTEVYPAGEDPIVAADSKSLARSIRVQGKVEPIYIEEVDDLSQAILDVVQDGDVVLVMGAGSVAKIAPHIAQLKNKLTVVNGYEY
ncbi:MAG: UDP-N-acetylmuramate--L-alanine ligase [Nitrosomonas sp.]|uniref:UDP-N-acetylmuramate--L-alanine ligase n=1 Tax=Nitrosomonas sp. TaxID=42353 RepID=UPI0027202CA9|nr:UDP-N-acetylmuramate--L-alanine ligase [Nitrosomonas sp.]MDO9471183.1 UDP-N-acetylmuramate--L-alanine ligase [Nitrosomonas sp.]MDP1550061.1 UDP-N-acetylmuramate--L-alanine ligase [Nitrosomonas sp.]MDP1935524.1 UDP-N-acetylmuramate--L-alanine ligase [Nitrosomonas sp.]MDP3282654.1 UDP-N-acetylmuramate--L-alanine ligase [Nitrosomonas sp.]MDP3664013.1 UDP-N-acetylmuramate--L-alanine ligase [Nitrosomonas sp.]